MHPPPSPVTPTKAVAGGFHAAAPLVTVHKTSRSDCYGGHCLFGPLQGDAGDVDGADRAGLWRGRQRRWWSVWGAA